MHGAAGAAGALMLVAAPALARDLPAGTDPVIAAAFVGCDKALANDATIDEALGWTSHDAGPDAMTFANWTRGYATREIAGAGSLDLSATVAHAPDYLLGTCEVTLAAPERSIAAPDLAPAGLVGIVEQSDAAPAWSGQWRDASSTLFLRAWLGADAGAFHFTMLSVVPETSQ